MSGENTARSRISIEDSDDDVDLGLKGISLTVTKLRDAGGSDDGANETSRLSPVPLSGDEGSKKKKHKKEKKKKKHDGHGEEDGIMSHENSEAESGTEQKKSRKHKKKHKKHHRSDHEDNEGNGASESERRERKEREKEKKREERRMRKEKEREEERARDNEKEVAHSLSANENPVDVAAAVAELTRTAEEALQSDVEHAPSEGSSSKPSSSNKDSYSVVAKHEPAVGVAPVNDIEHTRASPVATKPVIPGVLDNDTIEEPEGMEGDVVEGGPNYLVEEGEEPSELEGGYVAAYPGVYDPPIRKNLGEPVIVCEHVQKDYKIKGRGESVRALSDVHLAPGSEFYPVRRGEFVMLRGPSGGGKTTLLNIIGTLDKPTGGTVDILGKRINNRSTDTYLSRLRLEKVGFVFQTFNLLASMSAFENVELPMTVLGKLNKSQRRKRAKELLTMVGLRDRMMHLPSELSGGEQQRVTIARALCNEPEILLLDEPTGDLDTRNTVEIMDLLLDINLKHKTTMLMVTHNPDIELYADRILYLADGQMKRQCLNYEQSRLLYDEYVQFLNKQGL